MMKKRLNKIRMRPRFKLISNLNQLNIQENLKNNLKLFTNIRGNINLEVSSFWVNTTHNFYWKPYLSLRTEKEENKTVIRGVFGPSSAVWTFFIFLYFLFSIAFMVFITIWMVTKQIKSNDFPWAIYAAIFSFIGLFLTFLANKIGQIKAKSEMEELRNFADRSIYLENSELNNKN